MTYLVLGHGDSKEVSLLCEVTGEDELGTHFEVINGRWYGRLMPNGSLFYDERDMQGFCCDGVRILYTGPLPEGLRGYNAQIDWLNYQLQTHPARLWYAKTTSPLRLRFRRLTVALRAAHEAFRSSYRNPKVLSGIADFDDSIPF